MADKQPTGSEQLIQAAARISGKPAEDLTINDAFEILYQSNKEQIDQALDRAEHEAGKAEYDALSPDQQEAIDETAEAILQAAAIVLHKDRDKLTREDIDGIIKQAGAPDRITINTEHNPALDPNSPAFDIDEWGRFIEDNNPLDSILETLNNTKERLAEVFTGLLQKSLVSETITGQWGDIFKGFATFGETLQAIQPLLDELEELQPYLEAELAKPEYNGLTVDDLYNGLTVADLMEGTTAEETTAEETLWQKALAAAREARAANEKAGTIPTVQYKKTHDVKMSVDKWSSVFYGFNSPDPKKDVDGQMSFISLKYEKDGEEEITLFYNYGFDDEIISKFGLKKKIDDEDFFILTTIYNMFENGNTTVSARKLYKEMLGDDPNTKQLEKFIQRLYKLTATTLIINDYEVRKAWNIATDGETKDTYREIVTPLAPLTIGVEKFIANGKPVKAGIKILDRPYMMTLAKQIGQYTTVPKSVLFNKIRKSDRYYRVLHYTLKRIAQMKDPKTHTPNKILYSTFYKEIGETTANGKRYAKDKLFEILEHFKTCDAHWIDGYKEETTASTGETGVKIFLPKPKLTKGK